MRKVIALNGHEQIQELAQEVLLAPLVFFCFVSGGDKDQIVMILSFQGEMQTIKHEMVLKKYKIVFIQKYTKKKKKIFWFWLTPLFICILMQAGLPDGNIH